MSDAAMQQSRSAHAAFRLWPRRGVTGWSRSDRGPERNGDHDQQTCHRFSRLTGIPAFTSIWIEIKAVSCGGMCRSFCANTCSFGPVNSLPLRNFTRSIAGAVLETSHRACAGIASLDVAATLSCTTRNSRRFCSAVKTLCDNLLQYVQLFCAQPSARTQPSDYRNSSRSALAALRSAVSKPSVNQS
jgi:hypothetical protein